MNVAFYMLRTSINHATSTRNNSFLIPALSSFFLPDFEDDPETNYVVMSFNPKPVYLEWDSYTYSSLNCVKEWFESGQPINSRMFFGRDIVDLATSTCFCEAPFCGETGLKLVGLCPRAEAARYPR